MKGSLSYLVTAAAVVGAIGMAGCNNCEKLVEKVCTDLGPEDCQYWKEHGWDQQLIPGGRGVNRACGSMMSDSVYPPLLAGAKNQVKANRGADAVRAKAEGK